MCGLRTRNNKIKNRDSELTSEPSQRLILMSDHLRKRSSDGPWHSYGGKILHFRVDFLAKTLTLSF